LQVSFEYISGSVAYRPPWSSLSSLSNTGFDSTSRNPNSHFEETSAKNLARLYPNVRGCGYPPELNCEDFFEKYGGSRNESVSPSQPFSCWVSTIDTSIAMTELDLVNNILIKSLIKMLTKYFISFYIKISSTLQLQVLMLFVISHLGACQRGSDPQSNSSPGKHTNNFTTFILSTISNKNKHFGINNNNTSLNQIFRPFKVEMSRLISTIVTRTKV
jgi:hypothetical protein